MQCLGYSWVRCQCSRTSRVSSLCLGSANWQMWRRNDFPQQVALFRLAVRSFVEIKLFMIFEAITEFYIYLIFSALFNDAA